MRPIVIDARDAAARQLRGWGRYTLELVRALRAEPDLGLELRPITSQSRWPEIVFEQVALPSILRRQGAALVHAPNCFLPLARSCPGVVTIHDLAFETWPHDFALATRAKFRWVTPRAARSAQRVICPSQFTADEVCRRYGVAPENVRVIAEAPALARRAPSLHGRAEAIPSPTPNGCGQASLPLPDRYVLAVGDLRAKKNLAALVRAYVALRRREAIPHRLVLAGVDAGEGPRLAGLADGQPVQLTGYVDDASLDALLCGAELLVHPSLCEGFGLVVLEAMARGTPVLAARATALPETGGDAAEYFEPSDPTDLQRRLAGLLDDAERRAELSRWGLRHAADFTWQATARATAGVYRELL